MAIKQGEKEYLEEHSKKKVEFYRKYLDKYLKILLRDQYTTQINIYDIFCGVGLYQEDGSKGSPVVAMEIIKLNLESYNKHSTKIKLLINDGYTKRVNTATNYIKTNFNNICDFESYNLKDKEIFKLVVNRIKSNKYSTNIKNFIFIDPHGYKEIYKHNIIESMDNGRTEILIFLPISSMYRFLQPASKNTDNKSYEHLQRFLKEFDIRGNFKNPDEFINAITKAFKFNNKYFTVTFKLKRANSGNTYALIFITKHIKGLEEAVRTKWELDEICGDGFKPKEKHLLTILEQEEEKKDCFNKFKEKLINYLKEYRTNKEIYLFTLKNNFLSKDSIKILKELEEKNSLDFFGI